MAFAVITGGQGDLAQAIFKELKASTDLSVLAPGRNELDVTSGDSIRRFFASLNDVELLVNNAGIACDGLLAKQTSQDWDEVMATNLKGAWRCSQAVLPSMLAHGQGHIINVSSFSSFSGPPGQTAYAASKAGLLGLTLSLAREAGSDNIRSNAILPGFLQTRMTKDLPSSVLQKAREMHALGRFNVPEDTAKFIRFLHTEMLNVSGQVFQLDSRLRRPGW